MLTFSCRQIGRRIADNWSKRLFTLRLFDRLSFECTRPKYECFGETRVLLFQVRTRIRVHSYVCTDEYLLSLDRTNQTVYDDVFVQ